MTMSDELDNKIVLIGFSKKEEAQFKQEFVEEFILEEDNE